MSDVSLRNVSASDTILPPVDFGRVSIVAETHEEISSLLSTFFILAERDVTAMENSMQDGKPAQWKEAAHSLRGAASNLGMHTLARCCLLSEAGKNLTCAQCGLLLQDIRGELQRIKLYIADRNSSFPGRKS